MANVYDITWNTEEEQLEKGIKDKLKAAALTAAIAGQAYNVHDGLKTLREQPFDTRSEPKVKYWSDLWADQARSARDQRRQSQEKLGMTPDLKTPSDLEADRIKNPKTRTVQDRALYSPKAFGENFDSWDDYDAAQAKLPAPSVAPAAPKMIKRELVKFAKNGQWSIDEE